MDMRQKKKKRKIVWQEYIALAFMMLLGAVCGIVMVWYLDRSAEELPLHQELLSLAGMLLGMYAAVFFHLIVHEAGHLVFGLLSGYKFSSFRIGSLMWIKKKGKLTMKRISIAGTGGQCLMTPPDLQDGKMPVLLYNLGGSLINVVFGVIFGGGYLLWPDITILSPMLLIFSLAGFMIAMMNGIPMRMGTVDNDGYNAFALSKNKEAVRAFWVQMKVAEQLAKGARLGSLPADWFVVPADEAMKNSMVAACGVFACNRLMDEKKWEEADVLMAHLLAIDSGIVGLHRDLMVCDRMYVELIGENRGEVIREMMTKEQKKLMKAMKRFPSVLRTQYALALLGDKDIAKAQAIRREFDKVAKTYPYAGDIASERELMDLAERKGALV